MPLSTLPGGRSLPTPAETDELAALLAAEPTSDRPPPQVQGHQVVRLLGEGGSAQVWLVQEEGGGPQRALKIPVASGPDEARDPAQLQRELAAVGELQHEHLVRLCGLAQTDHGIGLLSEYHPGGSLGALVRAAGPLPVDQAVTVLVPVAQALQALHAQGVVHADLSPGNVLFTVQGKPAVADLGCAQLLGGSSGRGGTPGFIAPEVQGDTLPGAAADVYSLAAVGWYILTGRAPAGTSNRAPLSLTLPDVGEDVVHLLEAGLSDDPQQRPTAEQFATACYGWARPRPLDLHGVAHPSVARELPTRRPPSTAGSRRATRSRRGTRSSGLGSSPGRGRSLRRDPSRGRPVRGLVTRRRWWIGAAVVLLISVMAVTLWRAGPPAGTAGAVDPPPAVPMTPAPSAPSDTASPTPSTPPAEATAPAGSIATTEAVETTETAESTATADVSDPAEARPPAGVSGLAVEDPAEATAALASLRQRALTERDPELLGTYTVAGSPAAEGDARILSQLQDSGLRYQDLTLGLTPTGPVSPSGQGRVRIPARLDISAYTVVDEHGTTVEEHPAGRQDAVLLELERGPEGRRAVQVMAPPAG